MSGFTNAEQTDINLIPVSDMDKQIMIGNWYPVYINDGRIVGTEDED